MLTPEEANTLFSNIGEIVAAHLTFLDELEALMRLDTPDVIEGLGDAMHRLMVCSSCYAEYMANAPEASALLRKMNKKASFAAFTDRVRAKTSAVGRIGLDEMLMAPVQRMPRYQLLISQMLKYVPSPSRPRQRLQAVSQMARTLALRERDAETKQAAIRWSVDRHVAGVPSDLWSRKHHLLGSVDVDDFTFSPDAPSAEHETLAVTLLLFDTFLLIIQRAPGSSGTAALGLSDLNSLADLMLASIPGASVAVADQSILTAGLLQHTEAAQLMYKGHVALMDIEARDLGGPDFQIHHTDRGVQSGSTALSARWAHRPVRQYAVIEPPPPATKMSGAASAPSRSPARVQKTDFLESLWRAQARKQAGSSHSVRREVAPATFDPITGVAVRPRQIIYFLVAPRLVWEADVRKTPIALHVNIASTHASMHRDSWSGPHGVVEVMAIDKQGRCFVRTDLPSGQGEEESVSLGMLTEYIQGVARRLPPSLNTNFVSPPVQLTSASKLAPATPPPRGSAGQTMRPSNASPTGSANSPPRLRDVGRHLLSAAGMGTLRRSVSPGMEAGESEFASLSHRRHRSRAGSSTGGTANSSVFGGSVSTSNWGSTLASSDHTRGTVATTLSAASSSSAQSSPKRAHAKRSFHLLSRTRPGHTADFKDSAQREQNLVPPALPEKDAGEKSNGSVTPTPSPAVSYGHPGEPNLEAASGPGNTTTGAQSTYSEAEAGADDAFHHLIRSSTLLTHADRRLDRRETTLGPRPLRSTRLRTHPPASVPLGPSQVNAPGTSTAKRVASDRREGDVDEQEDAIDERPAKRVSVRSTRSHRSGESQSSSLRNSSDGHSRVGRERTDHERRARRAISRASKRPQAFADMRQYLNDVRQQHDQAALDSQYLSTLLVQLSTWLQDAEADSLADREELEMLVSHAPAVPAEPKEGTGAALLAAELSVMRKQAEERDAELEGLYAREGERAAEAANLNERIAVLESDKQSLQEQNRALAAKLAVAHTASQGSDALQARATELAAAIKELEVTHQDLEARYEVAARQAQTAVQLDEELDAAQERSALLEQRCGQLEKAERATLAANAELHTAFNEELDNMWRDATVQTDNEQINTLRSRLQAALAERNQLRAHLQYVHQP